jgi:hypothetical protein
MTTDDFLMLFIAFGGFAILALVLWSFARVADRKQDSKRGPDIRHDIDSPGRSNDLGRKEPARSGRANDLLRRFAGRSARARHRVEHPNGAVGRA